MLVTDNPTPGLFAYLHNATNFSGAFAACQSLTALPDGLFDGLSNVTTFSQVFSGCSALITTGNYLFRGCAAATLFERAFDTCTSLATIGQGIFAGCVAANSSLMGLFRYATRLTAVPDDLFDGLRAANFEGSSFTAQHWQRYRRRYFVPVRQPPRFVRRLRAVPH